jgi:hypothetical protein
MYTNQSDRVSSLDRALGISLAVFSMFVVGYTATRVFLSQEVSQTSIESTVVPHQAAMWSDLGR